MTDKQHIHYLSPTNKTLTILLYLAINSLFILKYASRVVDFYYLLPIVYVIFVGTVFYSACRFSGKFAKYINVLLISAVAFCLFGIAVLHYKINPYSINVDRWSAIHNFIENLFNGIYPYSAKTHLGGYGSPFPVWQFFHIPFYLLGNVGLAMSFSVLLLVFALLKITKNKVSTFYFLLLLLLSPAFWYEAAVRSDLFYNFLLLFIAILYADAKKMTVEKNSVSLGVIFGLFLSTRLSIVAPVFVFLFADFLKAGFRKQLLFLCCLTLTFAATFLPFIFWDYQNLFFFEFNPFVLQSRQGSLLEISFLVLICLIFSLTWRKNILRYNAYVSYALIGFVAFTFFTRMLSDNCTHHIFSSMYDITYFNMALPFICFVLAFGGRKKSKQLEQDV